jgi:hypothetical protein
MKSFVEDEIKAKAILIGVTIGEKLGESALPTGGQIAQQALLLIRVQQKKFGAERSSFRPTHCGEFDLHRFFLSPLLMQIHL